MKRIPILFLILISFGCKEDPETYIKYLNGYWEIEKVTLPSGEEHNYKYNAVVDYFKVSDSLTGFRTKLKPTLDGKFETSTNSEEFVLKIEHDSLNIYYQTKFSKWKETILSASDNELKIINANKAVFLYKPFKAINLN